LPPVGGLVCFYDSQMRRFPVLFATLTFTIVLTSCSTSKSVQQSAQTIATEAETILETSIPPVDTIATTTVAETPTTTTAALPPATSSPAPNSEAALRQRVIDAHNSYVADTLNMPNTDFATSKEYFEDPAGADNAFRRAIARAKIGGITRLGSPNIDEFEVTNIEVRADQNALVQTCFADNRKTVNPGVDRTIDTPDDELVSDSLETSKQTELWRISAGIWKKVEVTELKTRPGNVPCDF
jgi:hypothetical protein